MNHIKSDIVLMKTASLFQTQIPFAKTRNKRVYSAKKIITNALA